MPTAWSNSGALVSDRLRPPPQQHQAKSKGKGKSRAATPEPPKTKAVRELQERLDGARASNGLVKDPKRACFCQARKHALSDYVAICRRCGLILCTLNPPYCACPHCGAALSDAHERAVLIERLQAELAAQLAKEEAERQRAIEEARAAEGAFPTLPGLRQQTQQRSRTPPTTRTVLSLNSGTKKVTVSSYTSTPAQSRPASRGEERDEEEDRVPEPPKEESCVKEPLDPERPWKNVRVEVTYVPLPEETTKRKKGRGSQDG